jgi:hypothetical protein
MTTSIMKFLRAKSNMIDQQKRIFKKEFSEQIAWTA